MNFNENIKMTENKSLKNINKLTSGPNNQCDTFFT